MDNQDNKSLPNSELIAESYEQWIKNPVTQLFIKMLRRRKDNCANFLGINATRMDVNDAQFRQYGHTLKAANDILNIATNFELFKKQLSELIKPTE